MVERGAESEPTDAPLSKLVSQSRALGITFAFERLAVRSYPHAPKVGPFPLSEARGRTSNRRAGGTLLQWYYLPLNSS